MKTIGIAAEIQKREKKRKKKQVTMTDNKHRLWKGGHLVKYIFIK